MQLFFHSFFDEWRNQAGHCAAELEYFFHESRADVRVSFSGHHEDGFNARFESAVHQRHLKFVLVVGDGAYAAHDYICLLGHRVFDEQSAERIDFDGATSFVDTLDDFVEHLLPLVDSEERSLIRIYEDADDYLVEEFAAALDDVEMPI